MCLWNKKSQLHVKCIELSNIRKKTLVQGHAFLRDTWPMCCYRQIKNKNVDNAQFGK